MRYLSDRRIGNEGNGMTCVELVAQINACERERKLACEHRDFELAAMAGEAAEKFRGMLHREQARERRDHPAMAAI